MRYEIRIEGDQETDSAEQAVTAEKEQLARARAAVLRLAGVSTALFYGDAIGEIDLLAPATPIKIRAGGVA